MTATPPARVVVTVGTDHHRFDRLIGWVDAWAEAHPDVAVLVQHGTATPPVHARDVVMLGYDDLVAAMRTADVVVAQGGPATIMDARSVGHRPIVVPRVARLDEVVDDHQVTFAAWMAERELVWLAEDAGTLHALLDRAIADRSVVRIPPERGAAAGTIDAFRAVVDPLLARRAGRARRQRLAG
ncbi:MAG: glycosyl transferase 2 family protein [Acidimicrobiales bacterium]|nr:glycosyl transferase 2 family protein [Acidimicrobiales bacterium]